VENEHIVIGMSLGRDSVGLFALANQQKAIDRQITNQEILIKARKWTRVLLGLLVVAAFVYLLQPLMFIWWAHSR
jgi:hypothetical protein